MLSYVTTQVQDNLKLHDDAKGQDVRLPVALIAKDINLREYVILHQR